MSPKNELASSKNTMALETHGASLLCLPDELLSMILSCLNTIRSDAPQSKAFKDKEQERARQRVNRLHQASLHALSLSSRRLNQITMPSLYASFLSSTTIYGMRPLRSLYETLMKREDLRSYVLYVENRLSDYRGNELLHDVKYHDAGEIIAEYFWKLATIIRLCTNIQHLCVVSIESPDISLWNWFVSEGPYNEISLNLPKLSALAFQTNTKDEYGLAPDGPSFDRIFSAMSTAPNLTLLCASGIVPAPFGSLNLQGGPFKNLRRVEFVESTIRFDELDKLLLACDVLEHLSCQWALLRLPLLSSPQDFLPGLMKHQHTLQTLRLVPDAADVVSRAPPNVQCSSLRHLQVLNEASLCNFCIPDIHSSGPNPAGPPRIAAMLPPSIERLAIVYSYFWIEPVYYSFDILEALWHVLDDCQRMLPRLRELVILFKDGKLESLCFRTQRLQGNVAALTERFRQIGIDFKVVAELGNLI